jgi:hypothetical protein
VRHVEADSKNADDHLLLHSAARRFGMWFSRAGNGTSHPVHQQRFGIPGKTLLGADSYTPAAGGIGMLAIGAGGLEISMALTGEPFRLRMPEIWGMRLSGRRSIRPISGPRPIPAIAMLSGFLTWLVWVFIHVMALPQLQNHLRVQSQWLWSYWTGQRSSRLISEAPRDQ